MSAGLPLAASSLFAAVLVGALVLALIMFAIGRRSRPGATTTKQRESNTDPNPTPPIQPTNDPAWINQTQTPVDQGSAGAVPLTQDPPGGALDDGPADQGGGGGFGDGDSGSSGDSGGGGGDSGGGGGGD